MNLIEQNIKYILKNKIFPVLDECMDANIDESCFTNAAKEIFKLFQSCQKLHDSDNITDAIEFQEWINGKKSMYILEQSHPLNIWVFYGSGYEKKVTLNELYQLFKQSKEY